MYNRPKLVSTTTESRRYRRHPYILLGVPRAGSPNFLKLGACSLSLRLLGGWSDPALLPATTAVAGHGAGGSSCVSMKCSLVEPLSSLGGMDTAMRDLCAASPTADQEPNHYPSAPMEQRGNGFPPRMDHGLGKRPWRAGAKRGP